jgi:hypothetical protein
VAREAAKQGAAESRDGLENASMPVTPEAVLDQIITGGLRAQTVSIAAELGLADLLKDGPKTAEELAVEQDE